MLNAFNKSRLINSKSTSVNFFGWLIVLNPTNVVIVIFTLI
jgi:hypothetical protein